MANYLGRHPDIDSTATSYPARPLPSRDTSQSGDSGSLRLIDGRRGIPAEILGQVKRHGLSGSRRWPHPPFSEDIDEEESQLADQLISNNEFNTNDPDFPSQGDSSKLQSQNAIPNIAIDIGVSRPSVSQTHTLLSEAPANWSLSHIDALKGDQNLFLAAQRTSELQLLFRNVRITGDTPTFQNSYNTVWKGQLHMPEQSTAWNPARVEVAIKIIKPREGDTKRLLKRLFREVLPLTNLGHHPNIVPIKGYLLKGDSAWIISVWQSRGTVTDYVKANPSANRLNPISNIASGVYFLHSHNPPVVHGDLKGDNALVGSDQTARLADFGLSRIIDDSLGTAFMTSSLLRGCLPFFAPELLAGEIRTTESDMWALGGMILQIASGKLPFHAMKQHEILTALYNKQSPDLALYGDFPHHMILRPIIQGCWRINPSDRLTAGEVMSLLEPHLSSE